jgi:hypothetical protein
MISRVVFMALVAMSAVGQVFAECACGPDCDCGPGCECGRDFLSDYVELGGDWCEYWDQPIWATNCCGPVCGEWLPGDPQLMRPFLADPRQINYSAGWRFDDQRLVQNVIGVSYGEAIPIYRLNNVWPWCGVLQFEIEGAVWAVFDPLHDSSPLMNADYYIGIPITYAIQNWQFRLRGYHISSHIGDEFLLNHPRFRRLNPSAEYVDFFISHNLTRGIRLYAGVGAVVASDESYKCKTFYAEAGGEVHMYEFGFRDECGDIYGDPYFAIYMRHRGEYHKHVDMTYALGYEFGKIHERAPLVRLFMEWHDGYSLEGQFSRFPTNYFALRLTYGY